MRQVAPKLQGCGLLYLSPQLLAVAYQPSTLSSRTQRTSLKKFYNPSEGSPGLEGNPPEHLDPWGQHEQGGDGGQLLGLAIRGSNAKLQQQPGVQQVEPVPGTACPTPGRAGLAEAPCLGHPACTALLPRLPTFPRCHPPVPSPHQVSTRAVPRALVQGSKGCHFPVILGYPGSSGTSLSVVEKLRESKHGIRVIAAPSLPPPSDCL